MAVTTVELSDAVTSWVNKTNTIASDLGDAATLTTTATNLVAAINEINTQLNKVDSADVINLIQANALDSSEVLALIRADSGETSIMSNFQGDSSTGVALDSSQGRFFVPADAISELMMKDDAISSVELKNVVTLNIYDAGGSIVKTLYGAGS
jgi:hypothetical protein